MILPLSGRIDLHSLLATWHRTLPEDSVLLMLASMWKSAVGTSLRRFKPQKAPFSDRSPRRTLHVASKAPLAVASPHLRSLQLSDVQLIHPSSFFMTQRHFATASVEKSGESLPVDAAVTSVSNALASMFNKDNKVGKTEIRTALRQLKEFTPEQAAHVLARLSATSGSAPSGSVPAEPDSSHTSSMGAVLEESLARLIEVGFVPKQLPTIFSQLVDIYPEWRRAGWSHVIHRYAKNKNFKDEDVAFILGALPRDQICHFEIATTNRDLIVKYQKLWQGEFKAVSQQWGTPSSPRLPPTFYADVLSKRKDDAAHIVAHLAFNVWSKSTPLGSTNPYESFISSIYFAAAVLASCVERSSPLSNAQIADLLQIFNVKLLEHLKQNPELVKMGFNTYEYLEWVGFLIAETSKLRKSKFNDLFMIKKCMDVLLEKWSTDDVGLVSAAISDRFSVTQWIGETVAEYRGVSR